MRSWRSKIVFALVIYFSGFATAIYFLAPKDAAANQQYITDSSYVSQTVESDSVKLSANLGSGIRKCVDMVQGNAVQLGDYLKTKVDFNRVETTENN